MDASEHPFNTRNRPGYVEPVPMLDVRFSDRTVTNLVKRAADLWPDETFLRMGEQRFTYADAFSRSVKTAGALHHLQCEPGDVVALFMMTCPEFVDCFFGASHLGAVTFPLNTSYRGHLLQYGLDNSGCKILIAQSELVERVFEVLDQLPKLQLIVVVGADESDPRVQERRGSHVRVLSYDRFLSEAAENDTSYLASVDPYDVNSIIYTSGTSGPSKGVLMSNAHATNKASSIMNITQMSRSDVIYVPIPLFHTFGLHRGILSALLGGVTVVVRERFSASGFWPEVNRTGSTIAFMTSSMVQILNAAEASPADAENRLRCMFAAPYDAVFEERFNLRLLQTFSMTEVNNALYSPYFDKPRVGAAGRLSPDWDLKLVDDDGSEVGVGVAGEILLRPKKPGNVMLGYHNQDAANRSAFRDLWLHSGDLGRRDEDDYYYYVDRKKDSIRRRGENISSWEVETLVAGHPAVEEAVCLAYPSPLGEDDVWVIVTLVTGHEGSPEFLDELAAYCDNKMPDFMSPRYLEVREDLPKTPTEKVLKAKLREGGLGPAHLDRGDRKRPGRTQVANDAS